MVVKVGLFLMCRRTPSFERVVNLPVLPKRPLEELLVDDEEDPPKYVSQINRIE